MIIPDEARRHIMSLRDGVSEQQFLDEMWQRRYLAHGHPKKARKASWPLVLKRPVLRVAK